MKEMSLFNEFVNADCGDVLEQMPDASIDMFLQDLPYGATKNKWDTVPSLGPLWEQWLRVGKQNCAFVFTANLKFACELIASQPKLFRYELVWHKKGKATGFLNANKMPLRSHELILVFYRTLPTYNPQWTIGSPNHSKGQKHYNGESQKNHNYGHYNNTQKYLPTNQKHPTSILSFPSPHPPTHPTQKPMGLFRWLIRTYTNPGDIVFDGFAGSCTTAFAAAAEARNFICCETNTDYFNAANKMLNPF